MVVALLAWTLFRSYKIEYGFISFLKYTYKQLFSNIINLHYEALLKIYNHSCINSIFNWML